MINPSFISSQTDDYNTNEITLHRASQFIALTGVNLVPNLADDSHTTMIWSDTRKMLIGRKFSLAGKTYSIGLLPGMLELVMLNEEYQPISQMGLSGKRVEEIVAKWKAWLLDIGYEGEIIDQVHYELPVTDAYSAEEFNSINDSVVEDWIKVRSLANDVMIALNEFSGLESEINIWPHHFDTGIYYELYKTGDETDRSVGAGIAIADSMVPASYFYIYGWNKDGEIDFSNTPTLEHGKWLTDGWKGAVLAISDLPGANTGTVVNNFFNTAYKFYKTSLLPSQ